MLVSVLSCSTGPVQPSLNPSVTPIRTETGSDSKQVWGFWQIEFNPVTEQFENVPMRGAELTCNVIKFINGPPPNLIVQVISAFPNPDFKDFILNIGFQHPFPGLDIFTGFDVMGVFMGNGTSTYPGMGGYPVAGPDDQQLLNADGYTRWFNAPEFGGAGQIMPLQGYSPGSNGPPGYVPTSVLNPYKYYTDGLEPVADAFEFNRMWPDNRGVFRPGSVNYRRFYVRFPNAVGLQFQYAVIAHWEPNINHPDPPDDLTDFPQSANSDEAVVISINDIGTDAYYANETTYGGDIVLNVTPWDWSAECSTVMEEYGIRAYSSAWVGACEFDMTPVESNPYSYSFHAEIPVGFLTSNDNLPVWIEVYYPGYDFTSPVGVPNGAVGMLASYFLTEVDIKDGTVEPQEGWVYAIGDSGILTLCTGDDGNIRLAQNIVTLPTVGPFSTNNIVRWYEGHTTGWQPEGGFQYVVEELGFIFDFVEADTAGPVDTTGARVLILVTFRAKFPTECYSPEEIQTLKEFVDNGGVLMIMTERLVGYSENGTYLPDKLIEDLGLQFTFVNDGLLNGEFGMYTDFTVDPVTLGVTEVRGWGAGRFEVFGEGVSLMRNDEGYTVLCKSPMG